MYANLNRRSHGFTLIELLMTVTIIGILTTLATLSYADRVKRAARAEAKSTLLAMAAAEEKQYLENNAYTDDLTLLGFAENSAGQAARSESGRYRLSISFPEVGGFLAEAELISGEGVDAECQSFAIDHVGRRTSTPDTTTAGLCWK